MKTFIFTCLLFCTCVYGAFTQCAFDPTVMGNTLLCPNDTSVLSTQEYDAYQWYKRDFGTDTAFAIAGATEQELSVNFVDDTPAYFSVEVTDAGCTERSPEVLVDGLAFLLPTVSTEGDFDIGSNGEILACEGDSIFLELQLPYDTLITWFRDGTEIPNENNATLVVTTDGDYTVTGAPAVCPNFVQSLGVQITVMFSECTTGIGDPVLASPIKVYPNPTAEVLYFAGDLSRLQNLQLFGSNGQRLALSGFTLGESQISVAHLPKGMYILTFQIDGQTYQQKFMK